MKCELCGTSVSELNARTYDEVEVVRLYDVIKIKIENQR